MDKNSLGYLGVDFQYRLLYEIIADNSFARKILPILKPSYFDDEYLRLIAHKIIEGFDEFDIVLNIKSIKIRLLEKAAGDEVKTDFIIRTLRKIKSVQDEANDLLWVQNKAIQFCRVQEVKKVLAKVNKFVDNGDLDNFDLALDMLQKAYEIGLLEDDTIDVFDNIDEVLKEDYRNPIPLGFPALDKALNGGIAKKELMGLIAPLGTGKTTFVTRVANNMSTNGYNVLQLFFEDQLTTIQRKHYACWVNKEINDISPIDKPIIVQKKKEIDKKLKLKKYSSESVTVPKIKKYIKSLISSGFKPDVVIIDYVDCISASKTYQDNNVAEGSVMRELESLAAELDFACITPIQGNRSSIKSDVVESDQMGGSIKKGQIAHIVLSIARPIEMREENLATIALLKSRVGRDGIIYENTKFDNARLLIEFEGDEGISFTDNKINKSDRQQQRVNELMRKKDMEKNSEHEEYHKLSMALKGELSEEEFDNFTKNSELNNNWANI
jgi:KaiC/GvpD/RAD55 family RecA-like ATPase